MQSNLTSIHMHLWAISCWQWGTWIQGWWTSPRWRKYANNKGPALASLHACCFVPWLLRCSRRKRPCFLLVAMLLRCCALPLYPRRTNGPTSVAVANANALQLPLPPKPGWPVSPVLCVLRHAVGHLKQPWDPRNPARQEPPDGARSPVTAVDGMISGYDYDYDYIYMHVSIYICIDIDIDRALYRYIYIYIDIDVDKYR